MKSLLRNRPALCLLLFVVLLALVPAVLASGVFTVFDVVGATETTPVSINNPGAITGGYRALGVIHGFVRNEHGVITSFDPPSSFNTNPVGINNLGVIAGYFRSDPFTGVVHGFVRDEHGDITVFDPTNSK